MCATLSKGWSRQERPTSTRVANTPILLSPLFPNVLRVWVSIISGSCGIFPDETALEIADRAFRFCHIDVDVYQSGKDVLEWVWPRLSVGGVVVFDDFGFSSTRGIAKLVHEEEDAGDRVCLQNLNGHAVFVKTRQ
ncbi:MAG: class I SAM-dependent methyltransferase [bacterium]|nr:class I SAM-dependent methyltransferase [bacterium]